MWFAYFTLHMRGSKFITLLSLIHSKFNIHLYTQIVYLLFLGFVEYLLDRSVSDTKEAKEARYDIIKRLARSSAFESNILTRLQKYVEDGPFYMETNLQVAMEEGD